MRSFDILIYFSVLFATSTAFKILAVFPYNGRSHHIFFSSLVEELATRKHNVTVVNYFPIKIMPNLYQISLQSNDNNSDMVDIEDYLKTNSNSLFIDFFKAYDTAQAFKFIANSNCKRLMMNKDVQRIVQDEKFDLVIIEQFVTDCGLALAHKLDAPTVGMTAHVLMPWTYSRLGAPNNPSFVPNHFFGTGMKPNLWNRLKSALINIYFNLYNQFVIQRNDNEIVTKVFPGTPDLESLGRNISLILLNQYFPLTGSRLQGANVIEVGGMHINNNNELDDKDIANFLDSAINGVVYISFGSVAKNFPSKILHEITKALQKHGDTRFIWKVDNVDLEVPKNTLLREWVNQKAILCHNKVVAFITHSGMLSSAEAMHCGVPVVSVPLFGDQFANAKSAEENGLGITIDLATLDEKVLDNAITTVLQKRYKTRAKELAAQWNDRPISPMNMAVYWIEYTARHRGGIEMKPPNVHIPLYQYFMIDIVFILLLTFLLILYMLKKFAVLILRLFFKKQYVREAIRKKKV